MVTKNIKQQAKMGKIVKHMFFIPPLITTFVTVRSEQADKKLEKSRRSYFKIKDSFDDI